MAKLVKKLEESCEVVVLGNMVYCCTIQAYHELVKAGGKVSASVPYCILLD